MKKAIILLGAFALIGFFHHMDSSAKRINCERIAIGMDQMTVYGIMGEPDAEARPKMRHAGRVETWYWQAGMSATGITFYNGFVISRESIKLSSSEREGGDPPIEGKNGNRVASFR